VRYAIIIPMLLFLGFWSGNGSLYAQFRPVKLSPDRIIYQLPAAAVVQAAARIDGHTLAVWGTSAPDSGSYVRPTLVFQLLADTIPTDAPRLLHSDEARPFSFIDIVRLHDRFLVLWNDRRAVAPGIYARTVLFDGSLGDEHRISPGSAAGPTFYPIMVDDLLLFWNDVRDADTTVYMRHIADDGTPIDTERSFGVGAISVPLLFDRLPGLHILHRAGRSPILIRPDGSIEPRTIPAERFNTSYYLDADTSLTIIVGDTVKFYRSLFDQTPIRSVRVDVPLDMSVACILGRDSTGRTFLLWDTYHWDISEHPWIAYMKSVMNPDSTFAPPDSVAGNALSVAPSSVIVYWFRGARGWIEQTCDGARLHITVTVTEYNLFTHTGYTHDWIITYGNNSVPPIKGCWYPPDPVVKRTSSSINSSIRLSWDDHTVSLQTPTTSWAFNEAQENPNVVANDSGLYVTWRTGSRYLAAGLLVGEDTMSIRNASTQDAYTGLGQELPGVSIAATSNAYLAHTPPPNETDAGITDCQIFISTPSATWYKAVNESEAFYPADLPTSRQLPDGFDIDPNDGQILGGVINTRIGQHIVFRLEATGKRVWRDTFAIPGFNEVVDLLPVSDMEFIAISGDSAVLCAEGTTTPFMFTPSSDRPRYKRLLGSRFLRYYRTDSATGTVRLELYSLPHRLEKSVEIQTSPQSDRPFVLQNPKDSSLIILWGSSVGVGFAYLNPDLSPRISSATIPGSYSNTAHPAAAVRNDSLFVVWEDFRNNSADIYGLTIPIPPAVDIGTLAPPAVTIESVAPNPVFGAARLELFLQQPAPVRIDVVDDLGRLVYRETTEELPAGNNEVEVDLGSLFGGAYTVTATTDHGTVARRIVVYRK